jgi:hypothetical protein
MVALAGSCPLFQAILEWVDGAVVILNRQRQIVLASSELKEMLGADNLDDLIGKRVGEVFGCVHADEGPGGCGTSEACRFCGALDAISSSGSTGEPVESECRIIIGHEEGEQTVKLRVKAGNAEAKGSDFIVFLLQWNERTGGESARSATVLDPRSGWSEGLEQFVRVRKLGAGGMGNVFLVQDDRGRQLALKTVREEIAGLPGVAKRFLKEIEIAVLLDHPHVVRTYRGEKCANGTLYMVSEYCSGGSMSNWLQIHGPAPAAQALVWMSHVASAIDYVWREHRLIHRDVKPDNLLLDRKNQVKIADFGIARSLTGGAERLTVTGQMLGSIHYAAPEQISGLADLDVRTDLYAIGAAFFELLSGNRPFEGLALGTVLNHKLFESPPPLHEQRPDLPPELCALIDRLLATKPDDRIADPQVLLEELSRLTGEVVA